MGRHGTSIISALFFSIDIDLIYKCTIDTLSIISAILSISIDNEYHLGADSGVSTCAAPACAVSLTLCHSCPPSSSTPEKGSEKLPHFGVGV